MDRLIKKYEKLRNQQVEFKRLIPLTNVANIVLTDQNIALLNCVLTDLRILNENYSFQKNEIEPF